MLQSLLMHGVKFVALFFKKNEISQSWKYKSVKKLSGFPASSSIELTVQGFLYMEILSEDYMATIFIYPTSSSCEKFNYLHRPSAVQRSIQLSYRDQLSSMH
jgi:hypothetical protein